ncbi:unannotated protein [freshwater metagenome]|uniref:Unannotated protein n=1 Tax=freshwater metagenome TaxID=449393 RepID=A0A6J5Z8W3_9ZZZZ|nr:hypothetical protein [Actinomycetota bacterium]
MDIKLAKFAPVAVGGLFLFRELLSLVFSLRFDIVRYLFPADFYIGIWAFLSIIAFALKVLFVLGLLFQFKMYIEGNISKIQMVAGALVGIYLLRVIASFMVGNWYYEEPIVSYLAIPVFLLVIANLVIGLTAKDPNSPQQPRQQAQYRPPVQMTQPAQYLQQPVQNFSGQSGQSIPDQLAALQALVDAGTLTQAEFKAAKQRIIGG